MQSLSRVSNVIRNGFRRVGASPLTTSRHFSVSNRNNGSERLQPAQAATMYDIGVRSLFNEDHDLFRESVRKFFQTEVQPFTDKWEEQGQVDRELWEKAGEQGLLGIAIAEEKGGIGSDILHSAVMWEEQAYVSDACCGFSLHSEIVMPYIANYGTPEQVEKFIPAMTAGKIISAIAMTEPGAGSDLQGVRTNVVKDGDDYILNGSKTFITNGYMADLVLVVAVSNKEAKSPAHGISLFLVEEGMPGFKKGRKLKKLGLRGQDTAELFFEDVRLPKSALLGKENHGFYYLMQELPQERLFIADQAISNAEWAFETTRNYVCERKAFGKTISALQTVQHNLAEMKTEICIGRAFVDECILAHSKGGLDTERASMAKYWMTDLQNKIINRCLQLHGGWGYMWEYPISRAYANARVQPIYGGSNEIMKEVIARNIVTRH